MKIPKSHPRYQSLLIRERLADGFRRGLIHETGLIAHGRGEAFDYLIGEKTIDIANEATKVAAASLILAENPVISLNGNTVSLVAKECVSLSKSIPAKLEINLFHRTEDRVKKLADELTKYGVEKIYGINTDSRIPGIDHDRALCEKKGIFDADVVLVPLEDGDRCEALKSMGKNVITVDLNPLSRTARMATITIVDNVIRAVPNIRKWVEFLKDKNRSKLKDIVESWDNKKMLKQVLSYISKRLNSM